MPLMVRPRKSKTETEFAIVCSPHISFVEHTGQCCLAVLLEFQELLELASLDFAHSCPAQQGCSRRMLNLRVPLDSLVHRPDHRFRRIGFGKEPQSTRISGLRP